MSLEVTNFEFLFPIDGDCVNEFDGEYKTENLLFPFQLRQKAKAKYILTVKKQAKTLVFILPKLNFQGLETQYR